MVAYLRSSFVVSLDLHNEQVVISTYSLEQEAMYLANCTETIW